MIVIKIRMAMLEEPPAQRAPRREGHLGQHGRVGRYELPVQLDELQAQLGERFVDVPSRGVVQ